MKFLSIKSFFFVAGLAHSKPQRYLRSPQKLAKIPKAWSRHPAMLSHGNSVIDPQSHRGLLNGGAVFVVSKETRDGVEWCVDADEGTVRESDGQYPNVGLRPCAFMAGPTEQLFLPYFSRIESRFPYVEVCLLIDSNSKNGNAQDGDRVCLGGCDRDDGTFDFDYEDMINGQGQIKVADNHNLCLTYEGNNPDDNDRMVVQACENENKFLLEFRTGWYELGSGDYCVTIKDGKVKEGNRIVFDRCNGFSSHWRIDGDGLFHSRKNDNYCMTAESYEEDSPIRLAKCDPEDKFQLWEWPDGFEAPINLKSDPDLFLVVQGQTESRGDPIVIHSSGREWSGDAVHV